MAPSLDFPRGPSPYPVCFPAPSIPPSSASSSKRSSFDKSRLSSDATTAVEEGTVENTTSTSASKMPRRPGLPDRRSSLASLSVAHDPNDAYEDEPTWPSGWRPYTCLLGGFFLMFNSWGLVSIGVGTVRDVDARSPASRSTPMAHMPATTCSISCPIAKCMLRRMCETGPVD